MKGAIIDVKQDPIVQIKEIPLPEVGPDNVLVKVRASTPCGSDIHAYKVRDSSYQLWGHQFSGDVVRVGKNMQHLGLREGDRVVGGGMGSYAEYANYGTFYGILPLKLPDHVTYEDAATIEPMAVAMAAVRRSSPLKTDTVLIIGAGGIGLSALQILKTLYPVKQVFVADLSDKRLALASELGADVTINSGRDDLVEKMMELTAVPGQEPRSFFAEATSPELSPRKGVDIVFDFAGGAHTPQQAIDVVKARTGRIWLVAVYDGSPNIDFSAVYQRAICIGACQGYRAEDWSACLELIAAGKVDRQKLISHRFPLEQLAEAIEVQTRVDESIWVVIEP